MNAFFLNSRFQSVRGFTLLEVLVTMVIFILLAASVFGIITGVFQSASVLQDNQNHRDQIVALNAFLQKKLGELPAQSGLISYRHGDGEGLAQNGIILRNVGMASVIDAKLQNNGYYTLRLTAFSPDKSGAISTEQKFELSITNDDPAVQWTSLLRDIQKIEWKFMDSTTSKWVDRWYNPSAKPELIELSMQLAGDTNPAVMVFWIPPLAPVSLNAAIQPIPPPANHAP